MPAKEYQIAFAIAGKLSRSFEKSFSKAGGSVSGLSGKLARLNADASRLDQVAALRKKVFEAQKAFSAAQSRVDALARAMRNSSSPSRQLATDMARARREVSAANAALEKQRADLRTLSAQAGAAGQSMATLAAKQRQLQAAMVRTQRMQATRGRLHNLAPEAGLTVQRGGATAVSGITESVKAGSGFEASMSKVAAVSRASTQDLAKLTDQARELGATTEWSASQAAEGMQFLAMAGFKTEQTLAAMPGMLSLASAGGIDLGRAADIASNILTGFGLKADEMGRVGDVLVNTFTSSNTNLEMLGSTMKYVAPIAKSLGVSFETAAGMAGELGDAGIQGEMAGTGLRNVMQRLATASGTVLAVLDKLNVKTKDAKGNLRSFPDILADLQKSLAKVSQEIFGTEGMASAMILMEQAGSGSLQAYIESVKKAGAATEVARTMQNNFAGDVKVVTSTLEALSIEVYNTIQPALRSVAQSIAGVIQSMQKWVAEHPVLTGWLAKIGAAVGGLTAVALPLALAIKTGAFAFSGLSLIVQAVIPAFAALNAALLANPIGLIVGAVALLAGGLIYAWNNSEKFRKTVLTLWEQMKQVGSYIADKFVTDWIAAWESLKTTASNAVTGLANLVKVPLNAIIAMVNGVIDRINGFGQMKVPDWVPAIGGKQLGFNLSKIPALADGGIVSKPTLAMVGEAVPEAVTPLSKTPIGGITVNMTVNVSGNSDIRSAIGEAARDLRRQLEDLYAQQRRLAYA